MTEQNKTVITADQMWQYFKDGAVGTKEFRNWLAEVDPAFAKVRDVDVDREITEMAELRVEQILRDRAELEQRYPLPPDPEQ